MNLPDEPYWRCKACGMMSLDSCDRSMIVCGRPDSRPANVACPMEYVDPQPTGGALARTPNVSRFRFLAGLVVLIAALVIGGILAK